MAVHSRSLVEFGRSLNALTKNLTDGGSVPAALQVVREHFAAVAVVLEIERRGHGFAVFSAGEDGLTDAWPLPRRATALCAMADRYQHIVAHELAADDAVDYALWVFREREAPLFDPEDTEVSGVLVAQIARALDLASRIDSSAAEKALYSDALDKLNVGVIIVDGTGKVSSTSTVAGRFLLARDGLHVHAGRLRAASAAEDRELQAAIRAAALAKTSDSAGASRGLALTKLSGARTLGVMIRPALPFAVGATTPVAIYVRDRDTMPDVESEFVRQIFDLTPAEAAVTRRLTAGLSLEDAATSLAISRNTARAHLRSIFSKSGISRQTELVRLVLNSAAMLGERARQVA